MVIDATGNFWLYNALACSYSFIATVQDKWSRQEKKVSSILYGNLLPPEFLLEIELLLRTMPTAEKAG